ncbi:MAG: hypothetical protein LBM98_07605 [Oscillospiraceae bacterium]|nr:hypothetical protein [Oscillospiraceae bacterium]
MLRTCNWVRIASVPVLRKDAHGAWTRIWTGRRGTPRRDATPVQPHVSDI